MTTWSPNSWRRFDAAQQPQYTDEAAVAEVDRQLRQLPPLVTHQEVGALRAQLAEVQAGRGFILHGGDCAETFDECRPQIIVNKLKILLQMSLVLIHGLDQRVVRIGRIAGQYAKPRSADTETRAGQTLPSYRGDLINGIEFTPEARRHDPQRMLRGYSRAAMTHNYIRALMEGGFADLQHPEQWDLDFITRSPLKQRYGQILDEIGRALDFMSHILGAESRELHRADFFTSHEALHLGFEESVTRPVAEQWYNLSTHLPWIGARTAQLQGAHVEYCRGVANPIGLKVAPGTGADGLMRLIERLDPDNQPGRLVLIHRFGESQIAQQLPPLLRALRQEGRRLIWVCDPMHGNTISTASGLKTRPFDAILGELRQAFAIHQAEGSRLSGVHFELSGDDVTECTGGARNLSEADLQRAYVSQVDPRLNYEQAMEMAMLVVDIARTGHTEDATPD